MKILAFDIGGTKISSAVVSVCGKLLGEKTVCATPKSAYEIESYVLQRLNEEEFDGVAIATAGVVYDEKILAKNNGDRYYYQYVVERKYFRSFFGVY